jgi:hypothetical protein
MRVHDAAGGVEVMMAPLVFRVCFYRVWHVVGGGFGL